MIQYPGKLNKNRRIYFAIDNIYGGTGSPTSSDLAIKNNIVNKLKNAGLNIVSANMGPNTLYGNLTLMDNNGDTDSIGITVANGVDPTNIKEVGLQNYDKKGTRVRNRGNDVVLAYFWDACDFTRTDGTCYESIRTRNPQTDVPDGGRFYNPLQYCKDNKIYVVNQSTNNGNNPERGDKTGDKIAEAIIALFEDSATTTDTTTETTTDSTEKTIKQVVVEKTYTKAYYQKLFTVKTDENGGFQFPVQLPIVGKYIANLHYAGDQTHEAATRTITINNQRGELFNEKLLLTKTTTTYTDGSVTTNEVGSIGEELHTLTRKTTSTYENGTVSNVVETVIDNDTRSVVTTSNEESSQTSAGSADKDPFQNVISPVIIDGATKPNVSAMKTGTKAYEFVDLNSSYTLTSEMYLEVMERDSKSMQLNNYVHSQYTAFRCEESDKYIVLERERWNSVEECLMYYMVKEGGKKKSFKKMPWPKMKVDFKNKKSTFEDTETIDWKNRTTGKCNQWFVADNQNLGYDCGPTSSSVCTQVLHHYQSERVMQGLVGATSSSGSSPSTNAAKLRDLGFSAQVYSGATTAFDWLKTNKPCIFHVYWHYFALTDIAEDGDCLVCNSTTSSSYGPSTGWRTQSTLRNKYYGQGVLVGMNWSISEAEKTKINNFYQSMCGTWQKHEDKTEVPRYYQLSY